MCLIYHQGRCDVSGSNEVSGLHHLYRAGQVFLSYLLEGDYDLVDSNKDDLKHECIYIQTGSKDGGDRGSRYTYYYIHSTLCLIITLNFLHESVGLRLVSN